MNNLFEKYLIHPIERPITDADARVELVCSKDHEIMDFYYDSCFYRHDYVICDKIYALPYSEIFYFMSTNNDDHVLDATVKMEINGTEIIIDKPCAIQVPAFVPHGKMEIFDIKTPVFAYAAGLGREHVGIPEVNWKREDILPIEKMILYSTEKIVKDPHANEYQRSVIACLAGKTMEGEVSGVFRRFDKTDGWLYVENAHTHAYPEALGFYGTDAWNPYELNGTYTLFVGGKPFTIDKPTVGCFPPYVPHCPIKIDHIEKQNFWTSFGRAIGSFNAAKSIELLNINYEGGGADLKEPW